MSIDTVTRSKGSDTAERIARALFFTALVNFGLFVFMSAMLGGDAISGSSANGHYFLRSHGQLTEVSRGIFLYSRVHALSVFVTHPLGILAVALLVVKRTKRSAPKPRRHSD